MERRPLFNSDPTPTPSPEPEVASEEPPQKKPRWDEVLEISDDSDDGMHVDPVVPKKMANEAAPSRVRGTPKLAKEWETHYFGYFVTSGWMLCRSGAFTSLKPGDAITLHRPLKSAIVDEKKSKKDDIIIRFKNPKGVEVGRISETSSKWMAKLMDLNIVTFTGTCVEGPSAFQAGDSVVLSIFPQVNRSAFTFGMDATVNPITTGADGKKTFHDELKETPNEKKLRERKFALNRLFDQLSLQPVTLSALSSNKKGKGKGSKRNAFEDYDGLVVKRKDGDEEEEEEMDVNQLNLIYSKATKNDADLPEMDPPASFKFSLRGYQKQALKWMSSMEGVGGGDARDSLSMHPLWEEYLFPHPPSGKLTPDEDEPFYYNPCSGELSLEFPKASKTCSGGVLADEMGLGKTIMVAALIHTNTPQSIAAAKRESTPSSSASPPPANSSDEEDDNEGEDEKPYIPSPVRRVRVASAPKKTQTKLGKTGGVQKKGKLQQTGPRATLVVAPMTLLSQWCQELEKSSDGNLTILMYYGNSRTSIKAELESGVDVVVTSYGTMVSDFKKSGGGEVVVKPSEKGKGKDAKSTPKAKAKKGLYSVEWFRVVLDEAHLIKSRATQNAKATYALRAARRWCLTGTPIVNRLEDLYSLLHFIQLEPWGNFAFYKTFITIPFEKKDPKALEVIQIVLESILLRREKSMKDKNGDPIVSLPKKHIKISHLDFSKQERVVYDALYANAKSKFLGYQNEGTVLNNVTAIFSILMRLRQAVLHPQLVLKRLAQNLAEKKHAKGRTQDDLDGDLDEEAIKKLLNSYSGTDGKEGIQAEGGAYQSQVLQALLDGEEEEDECVICFEAVTSPVLLPKCLHKGCRDCIVALLGQYEEGGEDSRCPICNIGPIAIEDLMIVQKAKKPSPPKKSTFIISKVPSSDPNSSSQTELLTLIDSSDEENELTPRAAPKVKATPPRDVKGKGKAKQDSDDDDEEMPQVKDGDLDGDYLPSVHFKKTSPAADTDEEDEDEKPPMTSPPPDDEIRLLKNDFQSSTKLEALKNSLIAARKKDPQLKAVVFSQFTGFLDFIERLMNRERFSYVRLDGTITQKAREKVVNKFTQSSKSCIMIASLKAGGVGLNLVAASHVYLMDFWWNAAVEQQAIDRIHRFGQSREVYVERFVIKASIDEKMIALQERKTKIINGALGKNDGKSQKQLSEDLALIFAD